MVMVTLPTARRHRRSPTLYAFALLALLGAATTLVMVARYPAVSATEPGIPVPAPEITVIDERAGSEPGWRVPTESGWPGPAQPPEDDGGVPGRADAEADGEATATAADSRQDAVSRSLFWSGVIGLAISLAGLGLVGTRRRMW
ncbi:hypothetical protein [Micromonospora sp. NPDC048830]|uniref:hypothetical protein n=1 Tax=Micromonospora sp. NPDC048830 TaxID=3364257 RepID=UPI003716556E